MTTEEFRQSAIGRAVSPPATLSPSLQALWWDAREDWQSAHKLAQDDPSPAGSWVHAYLHRKEGDAGNAAYWYSRARRPRAEIGLPEEWTAIVTQLLADPSTQG